MVLFSIIGSCTKNDDNDESLEIFKVDINGVTHDFSSSNTITGVDANSQVSIYRINQEGESISLNIGNSRLGVKLTTKNYVIGDGDCSIYKWINYDPNILNTPEIAQRFATDRFSDSYIGEINLTKFDTINKLISGTFNGTLIGQNSNGQIFQKELTNGIFKNIKFLSFESEANPILVEAKIDGFCFISESVGATRFSQNEDYIFIGAYNGAFGRLELRIPSNSGIGFHSFDNQSFFGISFENFYLDSIYPKFDSSNFTITTHNEALNYIEGTFYITHSSHSIIEGKFKTYYEDFVN